MLSTEIYTNVLKTYSRTIIFLTEKEHNNLLLVGNSDWFFVRGQKIKGSNISEVLTVEEYYKQNPDKRPAESKSFPEFKMPRFSGNSKELQIKRIEQVIGGLKKIISPKRLGQSSHAVKLLKNVEDKLEGLRLGSMSDNKNRGERIKESERVDKMLKNSLSIF